MRLLGIVLIVLIGIGSYYLMREGFENESIIFLTKDETASFLAEDPDAYIQSMTPLDLQARGYNNHNAYWQASIDSALEPDAALKEKVIKNIHAVRGKVKDPTIPWKIALTTSAYEQNLPHTRQDIIFLKPNTISEQILLHEMEHLYQRKHKKAFQAFLKAQGYQPWRLRKGYPRIRANPDLDEYIYMSPDNRLMVFIYNESPKSIDDVIRPPGGHEYEHPNEEYAYAA